MDELLARARQGDGEAEKQLFQYLYVRFETLAKRRIGEGEAQDIAQEACLTVVEKYKTETFSKGFLPWAYSVLRMKIGNYMQGSMVRQKTLVQESDADQAAKTPSSGLDYPLTLKLIDCLKQIIRRNRLYARVLNLTHQGYKADEICGRVHVTPNNFYVILSRGRRLLRACLETGMV